MYNQYSFKKSPSRIIKSSINSIKYANKQTKDKSLRLNITQNKVIVVIVIKISVCGNALLKQL